MEKSNYKCFALYTGPNDKVPDAIIVDDDVDVGITIFNTRLTNQGKTPLKINKVVVLGDIWKMEDSATDGDVDLFRVICFEFASKKEFLVVANGYQKAIEMTQTATLKVSDVIKLSEFIPFHITCRKSE